MQLLEVYAVTGRRSGRRCWTSIGRDVDWKGCWIRTSIGRNIVAGRVGSGRCCRKGKKIQMLLPEVEEDPDIDAGRRLEGTLDPYVVAERGLERR